MVDEMSSSGRAYPKVEIEQVNDWRGSCSLTCNEFPLWTRHHRTRTPPWSSTLSTMGDCRLSCAWASCQFLVHVITPTPDQVAEVLPRSRPDLEVFIHNSRSNPPSATRSWPPRNRPRQALGFLAAVAGSGQAGGS